MNLPSIINILHSPIDIIISLISLIGSGFKVFYKLYKSFKNEINDRKQLSERIKVIFDEVTPNHGTSLKYKINRIEQSTMNNEKIIQIIGDRQKWILDKQQIPIFESDEHGMCTWANDAYLELLKRDSTEVLGNGWRNFIHEDDRERIVAEWESAVKEDRSSQSTYRMVNKDGVIYNVECYATKHRGNGYSGNIKIK